MNTYCNATYFVELIDYTRIPHHLVVLNVVTIDDYSCRCWEQPVGSERRQKIPILPRNTILMTVYYQMEVQGRILRFSEWLLDVITWILTQLILYPDWRTHYHYQSHWIIRSRCCRVTLVLPLWGIVAGRSVVLLSTSNSFLIRSLQEHEDIYIWRGLLGRLITRFVDEISGKLTKLRSLR